jgi:glycosyltransferase involved in cell wall biosynthesis
MLLDLAARTLSEHPDAHFALVGDGRLRPAVEAEIERRGLARQVHLLGIRNDVERILSASDLFLLPSQLEGMGIGALEAQAAGLPVVGSDIPGIRAAVRDGETALLFPLDSPAAFVQGLSRLIRDSTLRSRLGHAGRRRIVDNFTRRRTARELCRLYDACVTRSEPANHRSCAESTDI